MELVTKKGALQYIGRYLSAVIFFRCMSVKYAEIGRAF